MKHLQISPTPSQLLKLRQKVAVRHNIQKSKISQQKLRIISLYQKIEKVNQIDPLFNISSSNIMEQTSLSPNKQANKKMVDNKKQMRKTYAQNQKLQRYSTLVNSYIQQLDNPIKKENSNNEIRDNCHKMNILKTLLSKYNSKFLGQGNYLKLINSFGLQIQPMKNLKRFRTTSGKYNKSKSKMELGSITQMETIYDKDKDTKKDKQSKNNQNSFKIKTKDSNKIKFKQSQQFDISETKNQQHSPDAIQTPSHFYQQTKLMYKTSILNHKDLRFKKTLNHRKGLSQTTKRNSYQDESKYFLQAQQHNFQTRLTKYRQFLFIINYSNKIYRNLEVQQYVKPLKYYIGRGNNSNLIKSVMKNRFWWEECYSFQEADFVWTQIKIQNIFNIQKLVMMDETQYEETESQSNSNSSSFINNSSLIVNSTASPVNNKKLDRNTIQVIHPLKKGAKLLEPQEPQLKLLNQNEYFQYLEMWKKYNPKSHFQSRLKSIKSVKIAEQKESSPSDMVHNHLPRNQLLGNKKAMYYCLRQYCKLKNKNVFDIVPLTYHIQNGQKDPQFKQFTDQYNRRKIKGKSNIWIIKPGEFTNRGNGINCSNKLKQIKQRISSPKKANKANPNEQKPVNQIDKRTFIIQQYITRPLLYHNRKFDIRAYMLITSVNGKIKGYWYQDGYIRTSSSIFNLQQLDDEMIHLTNDAIQKNGEQYSKYESGNKITYNQLQRYINTLTSNGKHNKIDFYTMVYPQMKKIAQKCIKSTSIYLDQLKHQNNFQLFGLDFMIDVNYKPWLIEINTNPCLELSCGILERIIPHLIENVMRIVIDPIFPPPSKYPFTKRYNVLENALHYNKFQIIYDETRDGKELFMLFEQSKVLERIGEVKEDQEEFDNEGDIIGVEVEEVGKEK